MTVLFWNIHHNIYLEVEYSTVKYYNFQDESHIYFPNVDCYKIRLF